MTWLLLGLFPSTPDKLLVIYYPDPLGQSDRIMVSEDQIGPKQKRHKQQLESWWAEQTRNVRPLSVWWSYSTKTSSYADHLLFPCKQSKQDWTVNNGLLIRNGCHTRTNIITTVWFFNKRKESFINRLQILMILWIPKYHRRWIF